MNPRISLPSRRLFLGSVALGVGATALWTVPGLFAEELSRTPRLTEGPFYPDRLPLDTDSDLVIVNNSITPAVGTITHLTGRVLNTNGDPLRDHVVEILVFQPLDRIPSARPRRLISMLHVLA